MTAIHADIEPVGDRFGVAILPLAIGRFCAVAKLGDYDGRLLLVDVDGGVVDQNAREWADGADRRGTLISRKRRNYSSPGPWRNW